MLKKIAIILVIITICFPTSILAAQETQNYNYNVWGEEIASAPTFVQTYSLNSETLGTTVGEVVSVDTYDGYIYIVDQSNNKILMVDENFQLVKEVSEFNGGDTFNAPSSVAVNEDYVIVADTENQRVVKFDTQLNYIGEFGKPDAPGMEDMAFKPTSVDISNSNTVQIIASGVYAGIITTDIDGNFIKYTGTNEVTYDLMDNFWRKFASEEQLAQMTQYLPTEFTSLAVDSEGFIYTTTASDESAPIQKLNFNGEDVLNYTTDEAPNGDLITTPETEPYFISIDVDQYGNYVVIDKTTSKLYVYDSFGNLLAIYGESGDTEQTLNTPVDVTWYNGNNLLVADRLNNEVVYLEPTPFLESVFAATNYFYEDNLEASLAEWEKALSMNANYDVAALGIGKIYYRQGDYQTALEYFELADNKEYYSKAFAEVRKQFTKDHFVLIALLFISVLVLFYRSLGKEKYEAI